MQKKVNAKKASAEIKSISGKESKTLSKLKAAPGEAKVAAKTMKGVMQRKINKEKIAERKIKE